MDRQDCAILINSTPKYYYLLPLQLTLIRRYANKLKWQIYFATELPEHPICSRVSSGEFGEIKIIHLKSTDADFFESRVSALKQLPSNITYVIPLQEDFILDRCPMYVALEDALRILDTDRYVASLRLMPCPGPHEHDVIYNNNNIWRILDNNKDQYVFTYQATLWRRIDLEQFYDVLLRKIHIDFKDYKTSSEKKKYISIQMNLAESKYGQDILCSNSPPNVLHLAWPRVGSWSNAVYICPWPYRPTAVVRGKLEPFAKELFERERISFEDSV